MYFLVAVSSHWMAVYLDARRSKRPRGNKKRLPDRQALVLGLPYYIMLYMPVSAADERMAFR